MVLVLRFRTGGSCIGFAVFESYRVFCLSKAFAERVTTAWSTLQLNSALCERTTPFARRLQKPCLLNTGRQGIQ